MCVCPVSRTLECGGRTVADGFTAPAAATLAVAAAAVLQLPSRPPAIPVTPVVVRSVAALCRSRASAIRVTSALLDLPA